MYCLQLGSIFRPFSSLKEMLETFKALPWVQQKCCTLFDYGKNRYAEGGGFGFHKKLKWLKMP